MASLIDIANYALAEVGQGVIQTLDDDNEGAILCKQHIYNAIKETLVMAPWKCGRVKAQLAQVIPAPLFGWTYAYQLPPDYLDLVTFNEMNVANCGRDQNLFEIQGRLLLTNDSLCNINYTKDLTINEGDVNSMPPMLTEACYTKLAAKICWPLQQSVTLKQNMEQKYQTIVRKAAARDAYGSFLPTIPNASGSRWFGSIYSSTNG